MFKDLVCNLRDQLADCLRQEQDDCDLANKKRPAGAYRTCESLWIHIPNLQRYGFRRETDVGAIGSSLTEPETVAVDDGEADLPTQLFLEEEGPTNPQTHWLPGEFLLRIP